MAYVPAANVNFGDEATSSRIQQIIDNQADHESRIGDLDSFNNVWWEELGRTTLGSAGDTITVSGLPARNYLYVMLYVTPTGGTINTTMTFNGDTGSNYSLARYNDFSSQSTSTSTNGIAFNATTPNSPIAVEGKIYNSTAAFNRVGRFETIETRTAGAGTAPGVRSTVGKWASSTQISTITVTNGGTGDFASGSELIVLGHD